MSKKEQRPRYLALLNATAVRDAQVCTVPFENADPTDDSVWKDIRQPISLGIYHKNPDDVRREAAAYANTSPDNITLINLDDENDRPEMSPDTIPFDGISLYRTYTHVPTECLIEDYQKLLGVFRTGDIAGIETVIDCLGECIERYTDVPSGCPVRPSPSTVVIPHIAQGLWTFQGKDILCADHRPLSAAMTGGVIQCPNDCMACHKCDPGSLIFELEHGGVLDLIDPDETMLQKSLERKTDDRFSNTVRADISVCIQERVAMFLPTEYAEQVLANIQEDALKLAIEAMNDMGKDSFTDDDIESCVNSAIGAAICNLL